MITVHLAGIGCHHFSGPAAMEHAGAWVQKMRKAAEEDPGLMDTPDDLNILRTLSLGGSMTGIQVARSISRPKETIRNQILTLSLRGHVHMIGRGGVGGGKIWGITAAGRTALEDLEEAHPVICNPRTKNGFNPLAKGD